MYKRIYVLLALLLIGAIGACQAPPTAAPPTAIPSPTAEPQRPTQMPTSGATDTDAVFAAYQLPPVQQEARVEADPIAADLSNVELNVLLTPEQRARIAQNGFVVSPGQTKEFYELYERARYDNIPVFITSDSLLHVYHLLFDKTLRRTETESFIPMLAQLDSEMLRTSTQQYAELEGTPWAEAARRNAAYFAVAVKLLNPEWSVPEELRDLADPDLALIAAHNTIAPSAIFPAYPRGEDWSQYVPRGHYTMSPELERYFVAMMWHGRMTFRAADPIETQQAALLTLALRQTTVDGQAATAVWAGIYEPTVFFVGRSDDLTPREYDGALEAAYGQVAAPRDLVDEASFARFQAAISELRAPEILGMVVSLAEPDVKEVTQGLRFMGQRFVPDAFVFQQLIFPKVPERGLPKAMDFFAALGSDRALAHLEADGDAALTNYQANMDQLRTTFAEYGDEVWTQNLYWSWIHSLRPLLAPPGDGYPQFMRSDAWLDKQLTTALGSWTELKRDTILYAKQVYAEGSGAPPPPDPEQPRGYVEPVPLLFARVVALTEMTIDGLERRGLLHEDEQRALEAMATLAARLQRIAEQELRNEPLRATDYEFIRSYGVQLEALTFAAADESSYSVGGFPAGDEPPQAAVVADVATNAMDGVVLEEAVGRIFDLYVIVPVEDRLILTKGGVFSHYEFVQPLSERLTDEAWRQRLDDGDVPPLAPWTSSFMVEQTAEQTLEQTIIQFNADIVWALWFTEPTGSNLGRSWDLTQYLSGAELEDTLRYIEQLGAEKQFVGMQRLGLNFLSFDLQDAQNAIVTTRERWSDTLYRGVPTYDQQNLPVEIGVRPPYETVVTYTMARQDDAWKISRIVLRPEPPEWEQP